MFDIIKFYATAVTYGSGEADKYITKTDSKGTDGDSLMETVKNIINVALGVIGLIAVVMIILGGVQYTTSSGDAAKVKKAKDTIMYGVIGLVVALLAFAIVNFVLGNIFA